MGIELFLSNLLQKQIISTEQYTALSEIVSGKRFSLFVELRALLYLGVLCFISGVGLIITQYSSQLGNISIIGFLTLLFVLSIGYCFMKGGNYSNLAIKAPNVAFEYVLLLGCLLLYSDVTFIECNYHLMGMHWNFYFLAGAALFFFLAYRFDSYLVLSLALTTLAAWFGIKLAGFGYGVTEYYRLSAIAYGIIVLLAGWLLSQFNVKRQFFAVYLNFAANFLFIAVVSGIMEYIWAPYFLPTTAYLLALMILCYYTIVYSLREKDFLYFLYAVLYGYIGFSTIVVRLIIGVTPSIMLILAYFIASSVGLIILLISFSKHIKEKE